MTANTTPTNTEVPIEDLTNDCILTDGTNTGTTRLTFEFCFVDIGLPATFDGVVVEQTMRENGVVTYGNSGTLPKTGFSPTILLFAIACTSVGYYLRRVGDRNRSVNHNG